MPQFVLASNSPRRRELLARIIPEFIVKPSAFREETRGLSARETVALFAREKALDVGRSFPSCAVIGADTVVVLDGGILGKPKSEEDAEEMLLRLSGREHEVLTGVCVLWQGGRRECVVSTAVRFFPLDRELIRRYVASGLPMDKAGAYGIQDGYPLVEEYRGSYSNVMGLPIEETRMLLRSSEVIG